ncbi:MAG: DUF5667 domain-containing protein [Patescibacteria group bacterium]
MSNIAAQLRALKNRPAAGALPVESHAANKIALLRAIGGEEAVAVEMTATNVMGTRYALWLSHSFISRPVAVGVAGIFLTASGLLTTVSAAEQSLPGDMLYNVKLLNERTQLQLASLDRRAVLHTEFAGRRLQEVAQLQADTTGVNTALVAQTMGAYKNEITSANHNLQELQATGDVTTVATASQVQQNLVTLDSAMTEAAASATTPEQSAAVTDAQTTTQNAQENSVAVAVQAHQTTNSQQSTRELNEMFMRQFSAINARRTFDLHRVAMIRASLNAHDELFAATAVVTEDDLRRLERSINIAVADVAPAMDTFAAGGYRSAFDVLNRADAVLRGIEATLAEIETAIVNAIMAQPDTNDSSEPVSYPVPDTDTPTVTDPTGDNTPSLNNGTETVTP